MIIYNVTAKADHTISVAWLRWMKEEHIPDLVNTGCFTHAIVFHLFESDDSEGVTYAIQYHGPEKASYKKYLEQFADEMKNKVAEKWGTKLVTFSTVMQVVN